MSLPKPRTITAGPFTGVRNTADPQDDQPNLLVSLVNGYLPDPASGSAAYARPGGTRLAAIATSTGQTQGGNGFVADDGTIYNFMFVNGKVFRQNTDLSSAPTDVTPTNVWIATGSSTSPTTVSSGRFIFTTWLNNTMLVNDGVNKPWIGTNLGSTPITATVIDFQTASTNLSRGTSTDTKIKNASLTYAIFQNGTATAATKASTETALAAGTIPVNTWGVYRVELDTSAVIQVTAGAANFTTGYASEALAIAALPARDATRWFVGYFTVQTKVGTSFVGNTDALTGGASGNIANATNYYIGDSPPWVAFGAPVIYTGAVMWVLRSYGVTNAPTAIVWSEPNQPGVGYLQTNYNNTFTETQTGASPLYCLAPTNSGLYFSRDLSWGCLLGPPYLFTQATTHDVVSMNIGCVAPATVRVFGQHVWFNDVSGRTHRFAVGTTESVEELWLQARTPYDTAAAAGQTTTDAVQKYSWAEIEPNLNLYITGCYPAVATNFAPTVFHVYHAPSGRYLGTWNLPSSVGVNVAGLLRDANNQVAMFLLQAPDGSANGYPWKLNRVAAGVWQDNSTTITVSAQTQRFGYSAQYASTVQAVRAVTGNVTPVALTTLTTNGSVSQGTETPASSSDGTFLAMWKPNVTQGRGVLCTVSPTTTTSQWVLFGVEADLTFSEVVYGDK